MASKAPSRPKTSVVRTPTDARANGTSGGHMNGIEEDIRLLAYLKWEAAGKPPGDGLCYWIEAERELRPA